MNKIQPFGQNLLIGLLCSVVFLGCYFLATYLTTKFVFDPSQILPPTSYSLIESLYPGIWEEIIARGIILTILLNKYSENRSILYCSILFAVSHLSSYLLFSSTLIETLIQIYSTFFFSISLSYIFVQFKSLIPCIIIHYLNNAFEELFTNAPGVNPISYYLLVGLFGSGFLPCILTISILHYYKKFKYKPFC